MEYQKKSYVCIDVFNKKKPVLLVSRDGDDWCFLCGEVHPNDASFYRVVEIGHLIEDDPELSNVLDLMPNQEAERESPGKPWIRTNLHDLPQ